MSAVREGLEKLRVHSNAGGDIAGAGGNPNQPEPAVEFPLAPEGLKLHIEEDADEALFHIQSSEANIPETAAITLENAEVLARAQRCPYDDVDSFYERIRQPVGMGHSLRLDDILWGNEKERLHDQWLHSVDVGVGWKGGKVLGRGGNGIAGRFDWHGVDDDEEADRSWELAVKSICVKQSRALGRSRGLKQEGGFMKTLNGTKSKHFPTIYNFVQRARGHNIEGLHIDHAEREVNQLIMEFCPGGSLFDLIDTIRKKDRGLPEFAVWSIFICLAKALKVLRQGTEEQDEDFDIIESSDFGEDFVASRTPGVTTRGTAGAPPIHARALTPPVATRLSQILARMSTQGRAAPVAPNIPARRGAAAPVQNIITADQAAISVSDPSPRPWKRKIHFDLKPDNIFIGTKWVNSGLSVHSYVPIHKMGDLGMMQDEENFTSSLDQRKVLGWGTPSFIPPEQHKSTFREVRNWLYTTGMNVYQVGTIIWCIMLRHPGHFAIEEPFKAHTFEKQNGGKKTIKTRGRGLERGQRPTQIRTTEGMKWTGPLQQVTNYDYSTRLKDLVRECLALNHEERPNEDELLRRTLGAFGVAYNSFVFSHANLNIGQVQGIWERLAETEPSPPLSNNPAGHPDSRRVRRKTDRPIRPNTPPRMQLDTPPDYWVPDAAEPVKLYHQKKKEYWKVRNAQIIASRKYIRHHRNVVQHYKAYAREVARNREVEEHIGCDIEDVSEDEREEEIEEDEEEFLSDSEDSWVDWDALPTESGPRMVMGLDGRLTKRQWYFPGPRKERDLNTAQLEEVEANKLAEIQAEKKKKYEPFRPPGAEPPERQQEQMQQQPNFPQQDNFLHRPQPQRGPNWGGAAHVAAIRQDNPAPRVPANAQNFAGADNGPEKQQLHRAPPSGAPTSHIPGPGLRRQGAIRFGGADARARRQRAAAVAAAARGGGQQGIRGRGGVAKGRSAPGSARRV